MRYFMQKKNKILYCFKRAIYFGQHRCIFKRCRYLIDNVERPGAPVSNPQQIIRGFRELLKVTGLSRTQLQREMDAGRFPMPIPLTPAGRRKGWLGGEIADWQQQRVQARKAKPKKLPSGDQFMEGTLPMTNSDGEQSTIEANRNLQEDKGQ
jgi:predicted DNA-binding transcriptional regulator AlpA